MAASSSLKASMIESLQLVGPKAFTVQQAIPALIAAGYRAAEINPVLDEVLAYACAPLLLAAA